ncbi:MAG: hypothetical protein AB7U75_03140 [Hyphomicrobiaceae bacterium]
MVDGLEAEAVDGTGLSAVSVVSGSRAIQAWVTGLPKPFTALWQGRGAMERRANTRGYATGDFHAAPYNRGLIRHTANTWRGKGPRERSIGA